MDRPCVMHPADDCSRELPCIECPESLEASTRYVRFLLDPRFHAEVVVLGGWLANLFTLWLPAPGWENYWRDLLVHQPITPLMSAQDSAPGDVEFGRKR